MCLAPVLKQQHRLVDGVSTCSRDFTFPGPSKPRRLPAGQSGLRCVQGEKNGKHRRVLEIMWLALESRRSQLHRFLSDFMPLTFPILICKMGSTTTLPLQRLR